MHNSNPSALPTRRSVLEQLSKVIDPELGIDIVQLGLVYAVDISDNHVDVQMTMTTPACPVGPHLVDEVNHILSYYLGAQVTVEVHLIWEPPWQPEMMSDQARRLLGWT